MTTPSPEPSPSSLRSPAHSRALRRVRIERGFDAPYTDPLGRALFGDGMAMAPPDVRRRPRALPSSVEAPVRLAAFIGAGAALGVAAALVLAGASQPRPP